MVEKQMGQVCECTGEAQKGPSTSEVFRQTVSKLRPKKEGKRVPS